MADARQQFDSLPSSVRKRFDNDPYQLVRFAENPENEKECIKLGIFKDPQGGDPFETDGGQTNWLNELIDKAADAKLAAKAAEQQGQPPQPPQSGGSSTKSS